jgi:diguanylate cyclase (GGDEF)-like protein
MGPRTTSTASDRPMTLAKAGLVGVLYFCSAVFSLVLSHGPYGFVPLWPANAVLLALVSRGDSRSRHYLLAGMIASLAANRWAGGAWLPCLGFTFANMIEPLLARYLLCRVFPRTHFSFASGRDLGWFCGIAAVAALASGSIAALFARGDYSAFFISWFFADLLGMLIVTPIARLTVDFAAKGAWRRLVLSPGQAIEAVLLLLTVAVVSLAVFLQTIYPLLFLPLAAMMAAVVRLGTVGASISVLIIAVIASVTTRLGTGPVVIMAAGRLQEAIFIQVYLLVIYAAALPTAALFGAQRRLVKELRENVRLLNLAESVAQIGHWRFSMKSGQASWSDETFRIYGMPVGGPPSTEELIDAYIEEDREQVRAAFENAVRDGLPYEIRARIRRRDDRAIRDVVSRANVDLGSDGEILAVFGVVQDVTVQTEHERMLTRARIDAEIVAAAARLASETDPLTGLPNRRQLLVVLERAREQAHELHQPLSVAILDIDHFKRVNDTYGHAVGDLVLQRISQAAVSALRGTDMIGRFGGEEFIIVLPNAPLAVAEMVADRVRAAIEADTVDSFGDWPNVTASIGIASWQLDETMTALLQRADQALYDAKRAGRNRVCTAPPWAEAG